MLAQPVISSDVSVLPGEYLIPVAEGALHVKRWAPADGVTAAAPLVLFHDSLGCVELWRDFPQQLANATGHPVIAYDRLGFGRSSPRADWSVDFIRDEAERFFPRLLEGLGIQHFILFGYSVGGDMAASCAARHPDRCQALITLSAPTLVDERMVSGLRAAREAFSQPGQVERLARYHGDKAGWVLSAWLDTWLSDAFADWSIEQSASGLTCPTLVMHGDQDEYGAIDHAQRMAAITKGPSELVILKDCHHTPLRECPEVVLANVSRFLGRSAG